MNKFFYLLVASAMLFVACEENNQTPNGDIQTEAPELTLTSDGAMVFEGKGGFGKITYTLLNPVEGVKISAKSSVNWIIYIDTTTDGQIEFQVTENPSQDIRSGAITVTYGEEQFTVAINQKVNEAGADVSVELPNVCGIYYGNRDGGDYNYYFMITDGGMTFQQSAGSYDIFSYDSPNATYYFIDLFTSKKDSGRCIIPDGTYTLDTGNTGRGEQFMQGYSKYQKNDEGGWSSIEWNFSEGELVIEDGKMKLNVTLADDYLAPVERHYVEFNGTLESLVDNSL